VLVVLLGLRAGLRILVQTRVALPRLAVVCVRGLGVD
jgi:hypothetical protein